MTTAERDGDPTTVVRTLRPADLRAVSLLHATSLPHGFFARLGTAFLRSYYWSFARSPHAVALVAEADGRCVGVIVGTVDERAHYATVLRRHWWRLGPVGAVALVMRPKLMLWFLQRRAARYGFGAVRLIRGSLRRRTNATSSPSKATTGQLTHLAVDPDHRGGGIGGALIGAFIERVKAGGGARVEVVTRAGPDSKADLYERFGWRPAGQSLDLDDVPFDRLVRDL